MGRNYHKEFKTENLKNLIYLLQILFNLFLIVLQKKGTYFTFKIRMTTDTVKFIVDEDFYNEFVKAINEVV